MCKVGPYGPTLRSSQGWKVCRVRSFPQLGVSSFVTLVLSLLPSSVASGIILSVGPICERGKRNLPETPICTDHIVTGPKSLSCRTLKVSSRTSVWLRLSNEHVVGKVGGMEVVGWGGHLEAAHDFY